MITLLGDIATLLRSIRQLPIERRLKRRMLVCVIWQVAMVSGDFYPRYRSLSVIRTPGIRIQRDHIFKKKALVEELLAEKPDIDFIIERSLCCVVTADEHKKLHDIDGGLDGWDRYTAAEIIVYDMSNDLPVA